METVINDNKADQLPVLQPQSLTQAIYRRKEIVKAVENDDPIFIASTVEDADALVTEGYHSATCGMSSDCYKEYEKLLYGATVFIIPAKTEAGRKEASAVTSALRSKAAALMISELPDVDGKPVLGPSDFFRNGGTQEQFKDAIRSGKELVDPMRAPEMKKQKILNALKSGTILLPSDETPISDCAKQVFSLMKKDRTAYNRGNIVCEVANKADGLYLDVMDDQAFRSRLERTGDTFVLTRKKNNEFALMPKRPSKDMCSALLETLDARECLDSISNIFKNPIVIQGGNNIKVLDKGYHSDNGGIFIQTGNKIPDVALKEATTSLEELLCDFQFVTPADKTRMLSAIISPALRFGGLIGGHCPVHVMEADFSQAGKGFIVKLIAEIYGEHPTNITPKDGGVGSFDESLSAAIAQGRPMISFDNVRGKLDSPFLEMILTAFGPIGIRIPYKGESQMDPTHFIFLATSNMMESTPDLANRCCIIRIRKQPQEYQFKNWNGKEILEHIRLKHDYYRGCVFSIIKEWSRLGFPESDEYRHDFRAWAKKLDAILKMAWPHLPPMMEGHRQAQERTSNPALSWLRTVCAIVPVATGITASGIAELCAEHGIEIPGLRDGTNECKAMRQVGTLLARSFKAGDTVTLDEWTIKKSEENKIRDDGKGYFLIKNYKFSKGISPVTPVTPVTLHKELKKDDFPEVCIPLLGVTGDSRIEANPSLVEYAETTGSGQFKALPIVPRTPSVLVKGYCIQCGYKAKTDTETTCPTCLQAEPSKPARQDLF